MSYAKAVKQVNQAGVILVYPIKNERDPPSLWYALYPRSQMRWDWSDNADDRVVGLWHLKNELSENRDVVYAKWFRNRATFFSRPVFAALLHTLGTLSMRPEGLGTEAAALLACLLDDSPQTPKMLRAATGLESRVYASQFERSMRELWSRLLVVGSGEIDEGAFPALAVGATRLLWEDLWTEAAGMPAGSAERLLALHMPPHSVFGKYLARLKRKLDPARTSEPAKGRRSGEAADGSRP